MRMITKVSERGRSVATFRYVCVWMMETIARWTPTTPEMEAKVMMGRHIWEYAQMADALGKRTFELRLPEGRRQDLVNRRQDRCLLRRRRPRNYRSLQSLYRGDGRDPGRTLHRRA